MTQIREQWLKDRQSGIGGSDVAAILGISKWNTPLDVYKSKTEEPVEKDSESMEWGRRLEPVIRQKYCDTVGMAVTVPDHLIRSSEHPFMIANVDGIRADGRIVEIKTARTGTDWGEEGTDEIPDYYRTQVQHYMTVTGAKVCDVAVLIGASDFRIYTVEDDPELAAMLIEEESKFWKLVEDRTPPAPQTLAEIKLAFPGATRPGKIEADADIAETARKLAELKAIIDNKQDEADALQAKIQAFLGDNGDTLTINGITVATWKSSKPSVRLDGAALKKEMPDIWNEFAKETTGAKRFILKIKAE